MDILRKFSRKINLRRCEKFSLIDLIEVNRGVIIKFIKKAAKQTKKGSKVLDVGAGEGNWREFFKHCEYLTQDKGIGELLWDYSKIDYKCDITKISCKDENFDVILLTEVLEHLPEPYLALKELNRILKKKGKLYLTAPQGWEEHETPHDYYRYTHYGLKYLLKKSGFKIIKIEKRGGYFKYLAFRMWHIIFMPFLNRKNLFEKILGWLVKIPLMIILSLISLIFYFLDNIFDKEKKLTLGYQVIAQKK